MALAASNIRVTSVLRIFPELDCEVELELAVEP